MKYAIPILLAATFPLSLLAGGYSGETTVTAKLTVGAASSCTGSLTEHAIGTSLTENSPQYIANLYVKCPGALHVQAGLVGGNGDVAVRMGSQAVSETNVQPPYWFTELAQWSVTNSRPIYIRVQGVRNVLNGNGQNLSLPNYVKSLAQIDGSEGPYTIYIEGDGCQPCNLQTGSYTYQIKIFGFWA